MSEGGKSFDAWVRLGGVTEVTWKRKLANGIGHASFGEKLHAFHSEAGGYSFCRKHVTTKSTVFDHDFDGEESACTTCWDVLRLWWECGRFE